ncbi:MAG TPA: SgcJ/EcaC family oxidoreductase, partial [Terriglobales bacterium]|nr:SgcJ/EcaC family oxidoreductase [Terriglobales bacterium]
MKALEVKIASIVLLSLVATLVNAQTNTDEAAIRKILEEEVTTWNRGDADGYSRNFAADGTFTNVQGMFFTGYKAFRDRHEQIFKGQFRGTVLQLEVVS